MSRWAPGDQILWCYQREARPVTVISDDERGLAVWLAGGTPLVRSAPIGAAHIRDLPLDQRFRAARTYRLDEWRGHGIVMVVPPGEAFSAWLFRHEDGTFWGWYANLEAPHARSAAGTHSADRVLDVWMDAGGRIGWKDEDEVEAAVAAGRFTAADAVAYRADGERAWAAMAAGEWPFSARWLDWRPDPRWPRPELPPRAVALAGLPAEESMDVHLGLTPT